MVMNHEEKEWDLLRQNKNTLKMKRESHTERKESGMSIGSKRDTKGGWEKKKNGGKWTKVLFLCVNEHPGPEGIFFGYSYTILYVTIFSSNKGNGTRVCVCVGERERKNETNFSRTKMVEREDWRE